MSLEPTSQGVMCSLPNCDGPSCTKLTAVSWGLQRFQQLALGLPSTLSRLFLSAFLFWQAVNLMLRRWQCTHLGGPRETAAGCWTCPNRWVPSPTEHAVPAPSLLSFSSPSSFLFHLIQQEKWEVTMRSPRSRIECAPCRRQMLAACLWCLELGVGIWILLQCKTISLFQLKSIAILLFWEKTKFYIIQMTR